MAKKKQKTLQQQLDQSKQSMSEIQDRRDSIKEQSEQLQTNLQRYQKTVDATTKSIKDRRASREEGADKI
jgi:peptidoglycan hydrolase CwlO-like protein